MSDQLTESLNGDKGVGYSVVIEWENVHLAESARARQMLRRLSGQMRDLKARGITGEVLLVHDAGESTNKSRQFLAESFPESEAIAIIRTIAVEGKPYYEKKNAGARAAMGSIVIFLDSDVIPEPHWLALLLGSFERSDVEVVGGNTYIEPTTLYSKAFALFWFFPLRSDEEGLVPAETLFGNNIAFRRPLFLAHPFPTVDQFRGHCGMLMQELRQLQVGIFLQRASRCAHPPPNGLMHFVRRAMCDGHDNVIISRRINKIWRVPWRHSYWSVMTAGRTFLRRVCSGYRRVGLTPAGAIGPSLIALAYVGFMLMGDLLTRIDPHIVRRRFSI